MHVDAGLAESAIVLEHGESTLAGRGPLADLDLDLPVLGILGHGRDQTLLGAFDDLPRDSTDGDLGLVGETTAEDLDGASGRGRRGHEARDAERLSDVSDRDDLDVTRVARRILGRELLDSLS